MHEIDVQNGNYEMKIKEVTGYLDSEVKINDVTGYSAIPRGSLSQRLQRPLEVCCPHGGHT